MCSCVQLRATACNYTFIFVHIHSSAHLCTVLRVQRPLTVQTVQLRADCAGERAELCRTVQSCVDERAESPFFVMHTLHSPLHSSARNCAQLHTPLHTPLHAAARSCAFIFVHIHSSAQSAQFCAQLRAAARSCVQLHVHLRSYTQFCTVCIVLHSSAQFCTVLHSSARSPA